VPSLRRDWTLFALLSFCFAFGFAVYNGIFQNFIRETLGVGPRQFGVLESLREVPGLLTAFTAGTLVAFAEPRLAGISLAATALGIAATARAGGYWPLVALTMFWSVGFHLWLALQPAITMALSRGEEGGRRLGQMAAIGSASVLAALALTRLARAWGFSYDTLFLIAGAAIMAAGLLGFGLSPAAAGGERQRVVLRREYGLYYWLNFLEGCRRQIFMTFASFALIVVYRTPVETMVTLAFINAAAAALAAPTVGRWIDRVGERCMLTAYYALLVLVFCGYATVQDVRVLYGLYVLDSALFTFGVGLTTYLHRIVRRDELTPSLAMGMTMNHVAAVAVPATGGALWQATGSYQLPFWIGVAIVGLSLAAAARLPAAPRTAAAASSAD